MSPSDASKIWRPTASLTSPDSTCWSGTVTAPKSEWQPIETAPKDGAEFLAYDSTAKKMDVCVMRKFGNGDWVCEAVQSDGEYGPNYDEFGGSWTHSITHWMPLPAAPSDIGRY